MSLDHNPMEKCVAGERYEADVPDTLDLADRMALAINALTKAWFPEERWALGMGVQLSRRPAEPIRICFPEPPENTSAVPRGVPDL